MESIPLPERFYNAVMSCIAYLGKTFWPVHLAVFYPFEMFFSPWKAIFAAVMLILISVFVICRMKQMPFLFTGWFLYLGTLVPVIGLVQVGEQAMADRYTYLPSVGIAIMIAWGIPNFIHRESIRKRFLFPAAIAMLILLAVITFKQCGYWKNSVTLFSQTLRVTKNNHKIHHNLGVTFFKEGKIREALFHFDQVIKINPSYLSYNSRGEIFAREGRYREALEDFNRAIALNFSNADGYYNRGLTYSTINQYQLALADFDKAISLNGEHVLAYNNRGIVYARLNQLQQAIKDFTQAISINPDYVQAYTNRSIAHLSQGMKEQGCSDAQKACELGNCKIIETAHVQGLCR
jgi:Tfp pilus assembly protein PilF